MNKEELRRFMKIRSKSWGDERYLVVEDYIENMFSNEIKVLAGKDENNEPFTGVLPLGMFNIVVEA